MWPNRQFSADLVTFTKEILNGKLLFLCTGCFGCCSWKHKYHWNTQCNFQAFSSIGKWQQELDLWLSFKTQSWSLNIFINTAKILRTSIPILRTSIPHYFPFDSLPICHKISTCSRSLDIWILCLQELRPPLYLSFSIWGRERMLFVMHSSFSLSLSCFLNIRNISLLQ